VDVPAREQAADEREGRDEAVEKPEEESWVPPPGKGAASASEEVAGARSPRLPSSTLSTCQAVSGSSERLGFTFSGLGFTRTFRTYTNPTCTEPGTVVSTEDGTSYLVKQ
jgi:hypothetical protein